MPREGASPTAQQLLEHEAWLRTLALHLVREKEAAGDLFQETVEAAIRSRRPSQFSLRAWLFGIMRNLNRMGSRLEHRRHRREAKAQRDQLVASSPDIDSPEVAVDVLRTRRLLVDVVRSLREPYQQTILLRYYEGLSAADIARKTGLPPGTVRSHLKRGLDEIRTQLDQDTAGDRRRWYVLLGPLIGEVKPPRGRALAIGALTLGLAGVVAFRISSCAHHGHGEGASASGENGGRQFAPLPSPPQGSSNSAGAAAAVAPAAGLASAHAFYMAPAGDDSNPGTSREQPWKTFTRAIPQLGPGDTLVLMDGTYDRVGTGLPVIDCTTTAHAGTAQRPIILRAEHQRRAFLFDDGTATVLRMKRCAFWTIDGLRLQHGDRQGTTGTLTLWISDSDHIVVRGLLASQPNRFNNEPLLELGRTRDSLVEDCELYDFHVDGVTVWGGERNVVRRVYCNSRKHSGGVGGSANSGDACVRMSGTTDSIIENVVSENNETLLFATDLRRARVLGNVSRNDRFGLLMSAVQAGEDPRTHDSEVVHFVSVASRDIGLYARRTQNLWLRNVTILDSGDIGLAADCHGEKEMVSAVFVENALVLGGGRYAVNFQKTPCLESSVEHSQILPSRDGSSVAAAIGSCAISLPPTDELRGKGRDGADIGAEVLYRYEDGNLTGSPLWSPVGTGRNKYRFTGCGAVVQGVNSDPESACIGVHERLSVGAAHGCPLPY